MIARAAIATGGKSMVRPGWLEHPTYCFVGSRSIQLSYGRVAAYLMAVYRLSPNPSTVRAATAWTGGWEFQRKSGFFAPLRMTPSWSYTGLMKMLYSFEYNPGCNGPA